MPFDPANDKALPADVRAARRHFYAGGWSYRSAAKHLGRSYQHLCEVLNGKRISRSLVAEVRALQNRRKP